MAVAPPPTPPDEDELEPLVVPAMSRVEELKRKIMEKKNAKIILLAMGIPFCFIFIPLSSKVSRPFVN